MNYLKAIVPISLLALAILVLLYFFTGREQDTNTTVDQARTVTSKSGISQNLGQEGQEQEQLPIVALDDEKIISGTFQSVADGKIVYDRGGTSYALTLPETEVAIMCTSQDLSVAQTLDFNLVTKVKRTNIDQITSVIQSGQVVIILSEYNADNVLIANTVAVDSASCN